MIHHVFANRSNAGDWLSAIGIQQLLGTAHGGITEHLCDTPFVGETIARLEQTAPGDLIVLGGGGLFMDYFTPFWREFLPLARRTPFVVWGAGACDILDRESLPPRELIQEIVAHSRLCVVRDDLTRDFIGFADLPAPVACPTINALDTHSAQPAGVILHVDHYDIVGAENFEKMEAFAAEFAYASGRRHRKTNNLLTAGRKLELEKIVDLYAAADVVLTSRLHGCIIAAALGRPFLAVTADRKVNAFMRAAGLERWICSLAEVDTIPARLAELEREQPAAPKFIARTREDNRAVGNRVLKLHSELKWKASPRP